MDTQLASEILALEEQARTFMADLEKATDESVKSAYQAEIETVNAKLAAKRNQAEALEAEIQHTQTSIIESFDQIVVDGQTYSLRDFTINEQFAQVLSVWFQQKAGDIAQQYVRVAQSYKQENEELIDLMDERDNTIANLRSDNYRIDLIGADLQTKLENASNLIMEKDEEIKRLSNELKSVRENVSVKPVATNSSGNLGELMRAALATRPPIYNVRWKETRPSQTTYLATDANTGEEIEFKRLELGKYRVLEEGEIWQFRVETPHGQDQVVVDQDVAPNGIEPPALPSQGEVQNVDVAVGGESSDATVEGKTIEERIAALESAVFGQKTGIAA